MFSCSASFFSVFCFVFALMSNLRLYLTVSAPYQFSLFLCWFNGIPCMQHIYWQLPLTTELIVLNFDLLCSLASVFVLLLLLFCYWSGCFLFTHFNNSNIEKNETYLLICPFQCRIVDGTHDDEEKWVWMCWLKNNFFHNGFHLCGKLVSSASKFGINSSDGRKFTPI